MADEQISHWERLNSERRDLIAATEKKLSERKELLAKGEIELQKILAKKQHLMDLQSGVDSGKQRRTQYAEFMAALKSSGKTMDDIMIELKTGQA